jgi:hypothetical protein
MLRQLLNFLPDTSTCGRSVSTRHFKTARHARLFPPLEVNGLSSLDCGKPQPDTTCVLAPGIGANVPVDGASLGASITTAE